MCTACSSYRASVAEVVPFLNRSASASKASPATTTHVIARLNVSYG